MNTVITLIGLSKRTSSGLLWTRFWTCWFITFWEFLDYLWTCWFRTKDCFMEVVSSVVGRHGLCVLDRRPTLLLEVPDCPQCLLADFWTLSDQAWDSWLFSVISGRFLNAVWSGLRFVIVLSDFWQILERCLIRPEIRDCSQWFLADSWTLSDQASTAYIHSFSTAYYFPLIRTSVADSFRTKHAL